MPLVELANELLQTIGSHISESDLAKLVRTCRGLYRSLNRGLYQRNVWRSGSSALLWAALHGQIDTIRKLVEVGADLEVLTKHGSSMVIVSTENGTQRGVHRNPEDGPGRTALSLASERGSDKIVKLLLEHGAEPDPEDQDKQTPLSWAARGGHAAIVSRLLDANVQPDKKDIKGKTPLQRAIEQGHEKVVELLLATGRVDLNTARGNLDTAGARSNTAGAGSDTAGYGLNNPVPFPVFIKMLLFTLYYAVLGLFSGGGGEGSRH